MKMNKYELINGLLIFGIVLSLVLLIGYPFQVSYLYEREKDNIVDDCATLRSVIAEAYINIMQDPNYEYTGTDDEPMPVPETYYSVVESKLGHGRVYAVVDQKNNVEAYFGSPERNLDYYMWGDYQGKAAQLHNSVLLAEFIFWVAFLGLTAFRSYWIKRKRIERIINDPIESFTDAPKEGSPPVEKKNTIRINALNVSNGIKLVLLALFLLATVILRLFTIPSFSFAAGLLPLMADFPFVIALAGFLDALITVRELKNAGLPITLLSGILSVCLLLLIAGVDFGFSDLPYMLSPAFSVMIAFCWIIRGILLHRKSKATE